MYIVLPCILDKMIFVVLEIRNSIKVPIGSSLHAKKSMKLNGVTDRSLQSKTLRTRSSMRRIVFVSNTYFAPSTYND